MELLTRHFETGRWVRLSVRGALIDEVTPADGPETVEPSTRL